jgi:hypothetical protein
MINSEGWFETSYSPGKFVLLELTGIVPKNSYVVMRRGDGVLLILVETEELLTKLDRLYRLMFSTYRASIRDEVENFEEPEWISINEQVTESAS